MASNQDTLYEKRSSQRRDIDDPCQIWVLGFQANVAVSGDNGDSNGHKWFPDTGATDYATLDFSLMTSATRYDGPETLRVSSGATGEYKKLGSTLASLGIRHRQSCAYTHEQNGRVERRHRHVVETGLSLMAQASVPYRFWDMLLKLLSTPRSEPWATAPIVTGQGSDVSTTVTDVALQIHEPVAASGGDAGHGHEQSASSERTVSDQQVEQCGRPRGRPRRATPPPRSHSMNTRSSGPHKHVVLTTISTILPERTCYSQAVKFPKWRDAMDAEFNALVHNHTWRLVPSQPAVSRGWSIRQLDIHNAFLNGELAETVYMRHALGYEDTSLPNHVSLLKKSLYGLKQAPRAWFTRLHDFLVSVGFLPSKMDVSLFIYSHDNIRLYFLVYVDDILIMRSDSDRVTALIDKLALEFKVRDMGVASFFLGKETVPLSGGMLLSQQWYMKDILKRADMVDCKPVITPISSTKIIDNVAVPYADPTQYRSFAGALQYLTITSPDLSYAVNLLCQHMHAPTTTVWASLKRVLL
ncbi:PREDICTED: uncharacterized protein LOC109174403 [Ipomoea nil]|uniref:uncharacterized protein LOC109174403 n=1 Tax=Ipomoea nil TaxID=35883 RepID=UPI00090180FE|nr:PREDICTED: uncharacterized protein LOC109174403 [Ipomoea nil]